MHYTATPIKTGAITVLVVDEQSLVRRGCRYILDAQPDIQVVDEAAGELEAISKARLHRPRVIVLDPVMRAGSGLEAARVITAELPHCQILALTKYGDDNHVRNILLAGAKGCLLKDTDDAELVEAVRAVGAGRGYLTAAISDAVLIDYKRHVRNPLELLTCREREILKFLAEGLTNKEVATLLNLSIHTVDAHRGKLMEKLDLHSIGDIVRFSMRQGVIV